MAIKAHAIETENGFHVGIIPKPFDDMFWDAGDRAIVRDDARSRGFRTSEEDTLLVHALATHGLGSFIQIIGDTDHDDCVCGMGDFALFVNFDFAGDFDTLEEARAVFDRTIKNVPEVDIIPV